MLEIALFSNLQHVFNFKIFCPSGPIMMALYMILKSVRVIFYNTTLILKRVIFYNTTLKSQVEPSKTLRPCGHVKSWYKQKIKCKAYGHQTWQGDNL